MRNFVENQVSVVPRQRRALAFLEQAEDFYGAARAPRLAARPLLYYYSFMNLAKAFITVKGNLPLANCMHGLREGSDNIRPRLRLTSQEVKVNDAGTGRTQVYREMVKACGFSVPNKPTPIRVVDLLAQVVGIHETYCHSFDIWKRFFPIHQIMFEMDSSRKVAWISFYVSEDELAKGSDTAPRDIRDALVGFREVESPLMHHRKYESKQELSYGRSPKETLQRLIEITKPDIWSVLVPGKFNFYVSSTPSQKRLAQAASYYQAMFYFGSVTRYRPDDLAKMCGGKYGWLIEEFINTQSLQFIYLLGSGLIDAEMVVPETAIG